MNQSSDFNSSFPPNKYRQQFQNPIDLNSSRNPINTYSAYSDPSIPTKSSLSKNASGYRRSNSKSLPTLRIKPIVETSSSAFPDTHRHSSAKPFPPNVASDSYYYGNQSSTTPYYTSPYSPYMIPPSGMSSSIPSNALYSGYYCYPSSGYYSASSSYPTSSSSPYVYSSRYQPYPYTPTLSKQTSSSTLVNSVKEKSSALNETTSTASHDQKNKLLSCSMCFKKFTSAKDLSSHSAEHETIQKQQDSYSLETVNPIFPKTQSQNNLMKEHQPQTQKKTNPIHDDIMYRTSLDCDHYKVLQKYFPESIHRVKNSNDSIDSIQDELKNQPHKTKSTFSKKRDGLSLLAELASIHLSRVNGEDPCQLSRRDSLKSDVFLFPKSSKLNIE